MFLPFLIQNAPIAGHGLTGVVFFGVFLLIVSNSCSISIGSSGGKLHMFLFVLFLFV
jgi:hypothetical protein